LKAKNDEVSFMFKPASGRIVDRPIFLIRNFTAKPAEPRSLHPAIPQIRIDGKPVTVNAGADSQVFVSIDTLGHQLWMTLKMSITHQIVVDVVP
jgi:hypothetical protein